MICQLHLEYCMYNSLPFSFNLTKRSGHCTLLNCHTVHVMPSHCTVCADSSELLHHLAATAGLRGNCPLPADTYHLDEALHRGWYVHGHPAIQTMNTMKQQPPLSIFSRTGLPRPKSE